MTDSGLPVFEGIKIVLSYKIDFTDLFSKSSNFLINSDINFKKQEYVLT